jgi:FixJ family two-component response regulator
MNERLKSVARIYVVDSDQAVLNTLSRVLRNGGFEVITYKTAGEFIAHYFPTAPACLIVALHHPEVGGLDLQQWLVQSHDPLPVIFISGNSDIAATVRAMKAGAVDFLSKPVDEQQLLNAVDDALLRQRESISKCAEIAVVERRMATLTPREREVLMHVVSGQLNKQIAGDLGTVEKTIKVHRARVMRKMEAHSLAELVRMIARMPQRSDPRVLSSQPIETFRRQYVTNGFTEQTQTPIAAVSTKTSSPLS